jgi:hypothetical protein
MISYTKNKEPSISKALKIARFDKKKMGKKIWGVWFKDV